jgi:hypothetical protein
MTLTAGAAMLSLTLLIALAVRPRRLVHVATQPATRAPPRR